MTLRVIVQIVPFGDESRIKEIGRLNISNIGPFEFGHYEYIVKEDKPNPGDDCFREGSTYEIVDHPNVYHRRHNGFWRLIRSALLAMEI